MSVPANKAAIGDKMVRESTDSPLGRLRERSRDPLLTALTVLLMLMLFVFAPLQAVGIKIFQVLDFAAALGIIAGVFLMSGSPAVAAAMLIALRFQGRAEPLMSRSIAVMTETINPL